MKSRIAFWTIPLLGMLVGGCSKKNNDPAAIAAFSFSTLAGNMHAPATINFSNSSNYAWKWHWQLGDGDTSSEQSPSHQYTKDGEYVVKLSSQGFNTDTTSQIIDILPAYTSVQIDTIVVQSLLETSATVSAYFQITNGSSHVYWQSGYLTINAFHLPATFSFLSTPVFTNLNSTYYIELWVENDSYTYVNEHATPVTPYAYNKGTGILDSYPTGTMQGEGGLAFSLIWK